MDHFDYIISKNDSGIKYNQSYFYAEIIFKFIKQVIKNENQQNQNGINSGEHPEGLTKFSVK